MSPPPCTLFWPRKRIAAAAPAADVSRQQREVDEREHVVDRVVVLGDAQRPADHRLVGARVGEGGFANDVRRNAGRALAEFERVRLDRCAIRVEPVVRIRDEALVGEAGVDDLARHRVGQRDVAADVKAHPDVGPLGRLRPPRIDHVEPRRRSGFPSADGGTRSGAPRGRSIPRGGRHPSPPLRGRSSCLHPHRILSPDRRR